MVLFHFEVQKVNIQVTKKKKENTISSVILEVLVWKCSDLQVLFFSFSP